MSAGPGIRCLSACHGTQMGAGMELGKMLDGENKAGAVMMLDDRPGELLEEAKPFINLMMQYKCAIMEVETKFRVLDAEFSLEYNRNPFESIKSRLKSPLSIYEKLRRKGYPVTVENIEKHLNDVAGIRVICSFPDDIYRLADLISKQDDICPIGLVDPEVPVRAIAQCPDLVRGKLHAFFAAVSACVDIRLVGRKECDNLSDLLSDAVIVIPADIVLLLLQDPLIDCPHAAHRKFNTEQHKDDNQDANNGHFQFNTQIFHKYISPF